MADDVALVRLGRSLVAVACDSCAAAGDKPGDAVPATPYVVGRFTCRVPLLELLAVGARPFLVVATMGVEPEPAGSRMLAGIRDEARLAGVADDAILISTEKNIPVSQTALGVTVLGRARPGALRYGRGRAGQTVVAVGHPRVGREVHLDDPEIADIPTLRLALDFPLVGDAIPVGSRGIAVEATRLARRAGLDFRPGLQSGTVDLTRSAGPATCFLVSLPAGTWQQFQRHMAPSGRPCYPVGTLVAPEE
jgi:hypothetical protein